MNSQNNNIVNPYNIEAEQYIIGCVLWDPEIISEISELIKSDDFYNSKHKEIFLSIVSLFEKNLAIDLATIGEELKKKKKLDFCGGEPYLAEIQTSTPTSKNYKYYIDIIKDLSIKRLLLRMSNNIIRNVGDLTMSSYEILEKTQKKVYEMSLSEEQQSSEYIEDIAFETLNKIEKLIENNIDILGIPTGFPDLDRIISGLNKGELIIVAGRPSMGKTAFCVDIANNISMKKDKSVVFFSLEMEKEEVYKRMLFSTAKVEHSWKESKASREEAFPKIVKATSELSTNKMIICDSYISTVSNIRTKARKYAITEKNLGLIIVDYIQLVTASIKNNQQNIEQEVATISRELKAMARDLKVPVIAISQLSRNVENRQEKRPLMADLRYSGAIEQDADKILFIYRDEYYNKDSDYSGLVEIIVAKNRNGPTGTVNLTFLSDYAKFENMSDMTPY